MVKTLWGVYECLPSLQCENIVRDKMKYKEGKKSEVWVDDLNTLYLDLSLLEFPTKRVTSEVKMI